MGRALHLATHFYTIFPSYHLDGGAHRLHSSCYATRPGERVNDVPRPHQLDTFARAVRHPYLRTSGDALEIVGPALPAALVAWVVKAPELDQRTAANGDFPDRFLRVVARCAADNLAQALDHTFGLGLFLADHQHALMLREGQASQQVGLAAAGGATVAGDIGQALVGCGLGAGERVP